MQSMSRPVESSPYASYGYYVYYVSASFTSHNFSISLNSYGVAPDLDEIINANEVGGSNAAEPALSSKGGRAAVNRKAAGARPATLPVSKESDEAASAGHIFEEDWPFQLLLDSVDKCAAGVKWKNSVIRWCVSPNKLRYCLRLKSELDSGKYEMGKFDEFYVHEPKKRRIKALIFRDRVVQRAMCDNGLYEDLTRDCVWDNCACQKGKGVKAAMDRLRRFMREHFAEHGRRGWVARLDIHSFFDSLPHGMLKEMVMRKCRRKTYADMVCRMIDKYPDPGIGLGSQISQLLAMSYLSPIDHMVREREGCRRYIRYSDDIVAISESRDDCTRLFDAISGLAGAMGLSINPCSCVSKISDGILFLKWNFRLTSTGRVVVTKCGSRLSRSRRHFSKGISLGRFSQCGFDSWAAHMLLGDSFREIVKMRRFIYEKRNNRRE